MQIPSSQSLDKAQKAVRALIERLNAPSTRAAKDSPEDRGFISFYDPKLGGLRLSGRERGLYRECIETLAHVHGRDVAQRTLSRDAVERLLRGTILRTVRPRNAATDETRPQFAARLTKELRRLKKELTAQAREWRVVVQVQGLGPPGLPFKFGGVDFEVGGTDVGERLASRFPEFTPRRGAKKAKVEAERKAHQWLRDEIAGSLTDHAVASVTVLAVDDKAAQHLGIERVRRTVDVLNFFAGFLQPIHGRPYRAYLAPEGERTQLVWATHHVLGHVLVWCGPWSASNGCVEGFDADSDRPTEFGLSRAGRLLSAETRFDFEERIVNALAWAGRARVEARRDQAFLLYAIALEALLTEPKSRAGVTNRVRLRAAHLIGLAPETKSRTYKLVGELYEIRSALVHAGDSGGLTDRDLEAIAELVDRALTGVLTDERFAKMRTAADFERWFDSQILA